MWAMHLNYQFKALLLQCVLLTDFPHNQICVCNRPMCYFRESPPPIRRHWVTKGRRERFHNTLFLCHSVSYCIQLTSIIPPPSCGLKLYSFCCFRSFVAFQEQNMSNVLSNKCDRTDRTHRCPCWLTHELTLLLARRKIAVFVFFISYAPLNKIL